jgi:hypothetical protein
VRDADCGSDEGALEMDVSGKKRWEMRKFALDVNQMEAWKMFNFRDD